MTKKLLGPLALLMLVAGITSAQNNAVSVNMFTGSAIVNIPIGNISNGGASAPINLSYVATGVKTKDVEGAAGMGWQLSAGGQVTRTLRGLPDDCTKDNTNATRLGWLHNSYGSAINSFGIFNDGSTCSSGNMDISNLGVFNSLYDTEPDLFSVNAPGLSCQFVFDASYNIKTTTYQDVKITPGYNGATGLINSFTVVNGQGTTYLFNIVQSASRKTSNQVDAVVADNLPESNIVYFENDYYRYKNGVSYNSAWYLSSITDSNGNAVTLYYTDSEKEIATPVQLYIGNTTTKTTLYYDYTTYTQKILAQIDGANGNCTFIYNDNNSTNVSLLSNIQIGAVNYLLNYSGVGETSGPTTYYRFFLRDLMTDQCNAPFKYHFDYNGETVSGSTYTTALPDSTSNQYDYWGYYNNGGGADPRAANAAYVAAGSLSKITYLDNAYTSLSYQAKDYYNSAISATVLGDGIRIYQITDADGISPSNDMVRTYSYTDPLTSVSSGLPLSLPQYSFNRPYNGGTTADAMVKSDLDLSEDDHTVIYGYVKVSQAGAGSTAYRYTTPATYFATTGPDSWTPVTDYTARANCSNSLGYAGNRAYTYPFAPAVNLDFERGLIFNTTNFDDSGNEVSESNYTYTTTGSLSPVYALRFDVNNYGVGYAKYAIYTSAAELTSTITKKVYDLSSTTTYQQSAVNYFYGSSYHKLPTQVQTTNSDGSVQTVNTIYIKDYASASAGSSPNVSALYYLQQKNINAPVEQITQLQVPGSSAVTTGASLTLFAPYYKSVGPVYNYLPSQQLKFVSAGGSSSFIASAIILGAFNHDPNYLTTTNYNAYDGNGVLQEEDNNYKHATAIISDMNTHLPLAVFDNARYNEVSYTNFVQFTYGVPNSTNNSIFLANGDYLHTASGRAPASLYNYTGLSLPAGGSMTNSSLAASAQDPYDIFSLWVNSGTITLTLTGTNTTPVTVTATIPFSASGNWKYYEVKVPVSGLNGYFSATFQSNAAIGITDILMYPEHAKISMSAYDLSMHNKISDTKDNGQTVYYTNDNFGRILTASDKDGNILKRTTYSVPEMATTLPVPTFVFNTPYTNQLVGFGITSSYNMCAYAGVTVSYSWDLGDGTSASGAFPRHTYSTAGIYTVTCTVNAPGFTPVSATVNLSVGDAPPAPPTGVTVYGIDNTANSSFNFVTFSQGGTVMYTFTAAQLAGGVTVAYGAYDVHVSITSGSTYGSVYSHGDSGSNCSDYFHSNSYTFSIDLTSATYFTFEINTDGCE